MEIEFEEFFGKKKLNGRYIVTFRIHDLSAQITKSIEEIFCGLINRSPQNISFSNEKAQATWDKEWNRSLNEIDLFEMRPFIDKIFIDDGAHLTTKERFDIFHHINPRIFNYKTSTSLHTVSLEFNQFKRLFSKTKNKSLSEKWETAKKFNAENNINSQLFLSTQFDSLNEFFNFLLLKLVMNNSTLKICANCGKYFYPENRSDTIYCNNISPQDEKKTCKEYGAIKTYQDNLKTNETMGLYRKIYMKKQMKAKRYPDIPEYLQKFEEFKERANELKRKVKNNEISESEYLEWLKQQ